jgi:hypothetical protein
MAGFNDAVLDDAKGRVRQALEESEPLELLAFPFGEANLFLSNNPEKVLGYVSFTMAGTEFWIGFRPEDVEPAKKDRQQAARPDDCASGRCRAAHAPCICRLRG